MTKRVHFTDHAGPICGRNPHANEDTRNPREVTCRACQRKLGEMAGGLQTFVSLLEEFYDPGETWK